ncbi:MAG TPA: hypothetical protein PKE29_16455 [Phycisphaerales bacterium]|nr:hypothetical protein [Phycisphaerales bacterium]
MPCLALYLVAALPCLHEPLPAPAADAPAPPAAPSTSTPTPTPTPAPSSPTLTNLPLPARESASKRARFVYRLPDNSVWDSFYYVEFRRVLADYDMLAKGVPLPASCESWGFTSNRRGPTDKSERPAPLWHTLQPPRATTPYTPFIYVNESLLSAKDRKRGPMLKCGKETAPHVYEFRFSEYPGSDHAVGRLPLAINLGYASGLLRLPTSIRPAADGSLTGEFFLVSDPTAATDAKSKNGHPGLKLIHAQDLRLTPDQYAAELLTRRAELIQWSFTRTPSRFGDTFTWKKTVVDVGPRTTQPAAPPSK